jgi:hypothetical protein
VKIRSFIAAAALTISLSGCVIDPAMLSGLYEGQQPASYGYRAPAYGSGSQPSLSYGYQRPTAIYPPPPSYGNIYDGGRQRRPHGGPFKGRH